MNALCQCAESHPVEKIVISFSIDEKEREGRHESCEKGERTIQSPSKTLKQEVEEAKRKLAMLQESYERDDQGNVKFYELQSKRYRVRKR